MRGQGRGVHGARCAIGVPFVVEYYNHLDDRYALVAYLLFENVPMCLVSKGGQGFI